MNTKGVFEVLCLAAREMLNQMLQVNQAVVDGRGRQHKNLLVFSKVLHLPVTRATFFNAWVAKVVRLVNHDDIGLLLKPLHALGPLAAALQVGVVDNDKVREISKQLRQVAAQAGLPHGLPKFDTTSPIF